MRYLLDTHVFLWAITNDGRLSRRHKAVFIEEAADLYLSAASVWEILVKVAIGRIALPVPVAPYLSRQMDLNRIGLLPIRMLHFVELETLAPLHKDPFDRMIVAQARAERMLLLTADKAIMRYPIKLG